MESIKLDQCTRLGGFFCHPDMDKRRVHILETHQPLVLQHPHDHERWEVTGEEVEEILRHYGHHNLSAVVSEHSIVIFSTVHQTYISGAI